jgi:hypothetical protein
MLAFVAFFTDSAFYFDPGNVLFEHWKFYVYQVNTHCEIVLSYTLEKQEVRLFEFF